MSELINQESVTARSEEETKLLKEKAKIQGAMATNLGGVLLAFTPIVFILSRYTEEEMVFYLGFIAFALGLGFFLFGRNLKKLSQ